jgi:hypothetical protein
MRPTGKSCVPRTPRKWGSLVDFRAAFGEPPRVSAPIPPARITLPDGTSVTSAQGDINQILSHVLGRAVTVATRAPQAPCLEAYWPDMEGLAHRDTITGPCPRWVMTTLPQGDLPRDPGILRTAAQHHQVNVGVYADVRQGGTIRRGDPVRLASSPHP